MNARWIDQTRTRDTHPDVRGDCTRAAIASLFAMPLDAVPDFNADDPVAFYDDVEAFFLSLGYEMVRLDGNVALDALHLANGPAARGIHHTVVRRGAKVVHDPHPSRAGLDEIDFVIVPVPLDPSALLPAQVYRERLQAIMDWADLAHSASHEFASHGLGLLRGPVFDEARATLSGRQGGAVPAGELPSVEAFAEALFYSVDWTNKEVVWAEIAGDRTAITQAVVRRFRQQATTLRARLAEQAALAEAPCTGCDGTGRVDTDTGGNFYQGDCRHCRGTGQDQQPAPAGTGADRVEGLRPGLEKALEIVRAEMETASSHSGSYQRLGSVGLALRAALDGASGQEGR